MAGKEGKHKEVREAEGSKEGRDRNGREGSTEIRGTEARKQGRKRWKGRKEYRKRGKEERKERANKACRWRATGVAH